MKVYFFWILLSYSCLFGQEVKSFEAVKTENLFLVTLDGLRWQELFGGADGEIIRQNAFVKDTSSLIKKFWREDPILRRQNLMPFFWNTIASRGILLGNRLFENKVQCTNIFWFSYPGYAEILCGFSDAQHIRSNDKIPNPNKTFLEYLHETSRFQNKVAVFGSWDVFPFIINVERSGIPVNAGFSPSKDEKLSAREIFLNELQGQIPSPWASVRLDAFTHHYALEYIKRNRPRVVYLAYGETDDFAHDARYDHYLEAAHRSDQLIADLWNFIQSHKFYKDRTSLVITTDHGRGGAKDGEWTSHGSKIEGAGAIWLAVMGPDTPALGEVEEPGSYTQSQVAATCMYLLGQPFFPAKEAGSPILKVIKP